MSQNLTCTRIGKYRPNTDVEDLFGSFRKGLNTLNGIKTMISPTVPKNKIFVINDEVANYFNQAYDRFSKKELKNWVWHDFTKLRPETIQKIRKCRKIALAKAKCRLS